MLWKRYQVQGRNGIEWSRWFKYGGKTRSKWQLKGKLLNEYRETEGSEPPPSTLEPHHDKDE